MAGPAMAIGYILLAILGLGLLALFLYLLYFAIIYRHRSLKAILAGILFAGITTLTLYLFLRKKEANPRYLGDYKLEKLDRQKCENCLVRLKEDFTYDIIVSGRVVGNGNWHTVTGIDDVALFIEYSTYCYLLNDGKEIEEIDRSGKP
jgi:hypothetical protein